jgi:hypothetical protein
MPAKEPTPAGLILDRLHEQLGRLSRQITAGKGGMITDADIRGLFEGFFAAIPQFDTQQYEAQYRLSCNGLLLQPAYVLLKRWNSIAKQAQRLDADVLLKPYTDHLHQALDSMQVAARRTQHLSAVFDDKWVEEVRQLIAAYDGVDSFGTDTHTAFIGFLQEMREGGDLLAHLDAAFGAIAQVAGRQRVKTLKKKLRDISRPLPNYLGTVFELLVVGPCAAAGWLKEYEPKVGTRYAEGLIVVEGVRLLLEATVAATGRDLAGFQSIDLGEGTSRTRCKILDKAQQLQAANDPILLFLSPHHSTVPPELKMGIAEAFQQDACRRIAGVVVSDSYCVHHLRVAWNSSGCPVPIAARDRLSKLYPLHPFDVEDLWSEH